MYVPIRRDRSQCPGGTQRCNNTILYGLYIILLYYIRGYNNNNNDNR